MEAAMVVLGVVVTMAEVARKVRSSQGAKAVLMVALMVAGAMTAVVVVLEVAWKAVVAMALEALEQAVVVAMEAAVEAKEAMVMVRVEREVEVAAWVVRVAWVAPEAVCWAAAVKAQEVLGLAAAAAMEEKGVETAPAARAQG